jgi:hypothetical protein
MRLGFGRKGRSEEAPASAPAAPATVPPLAQSAAGAAQAAPAGVPGVGRSPAIESFKAASEAVKAREAAQTPPPRAH